MKVSLTFFILTLSFSAVSSEHCFLHNYVERSISPVREVTFTEPESGMMVTKIIPKDTSPRLKEILEFSRSNNMIFVKGPTPLTTSEKTIYARIPDEALVSEEALTGHLEKAILGHFDAPLNYQRLPAQSQKLVQEMKKKFNTRFINEADDHGVSYTYHNKIGVKLRHPDNLRVNGVVIHEITHNTTDRKVLEAFNPKLVKNITSETRAAQPFTGALATREMRVKAKPGKSMKVPNSLEGYEKYYRSDEIEARIREIAQSKKDDLTVDSTLQEMNDLINYQEQQIQSLLKNDDLKINTADAEPELGGGRRQRRTVTTQDADFELSILVPRYLSGSQERTFITNSLKERLQTLQGYRRSMQQRLQ